jgi:hypothetical protein
LLSVDFFAGFGQTEESLIIFLLYLQRRPLSYNPCKILYKSSLNIGRGESELLRRAKVPGGGRHAKKPINGVFIGVYIQTEPAVPLGLLSLLPFADGNVTAQRKIAQRQDEGDAGHAKTRMSGDQIGRAHV